MGLAWKKALFRSLAGTIRLKHVRQGLAHCCVFTRESGVRERDHSVGAMHLLACAGSQVQPQQHAHQAECRSVILVLLRWK